MPRGFRVGYLSGLLAAALLLPVVAGAASGGDPTCAKSYITLRKGPGAQFPVSWRVARYMPFLRFETKNGWVKVRDLDGETHYAQGHDLSSANSCVVVKAAVATLRSAASASAPPSDIKTVDRFTPFKKIEMQGDWVYVEDETGHPAWIHESNVWRPVKIQSVDF